MFLAIIHYVMTIIMSFCPTKVSTYVMLSIAKSTAPVVPRLVEQDLRELLQVHMMEAI